MTKDEAILQAAEDALACAKEKYPLINWQAGLKDSDLLIAVKIFNAGYEFANRWNVVERDGLPEIDGWYEFTFQYENGQLEVRKRYVEKDFRENLRPNYIAWRPRSEPYKEAE